MSPSLDRLMTTGEDTSNRRCEDKDMSSSSDRLMTIGGDTSDRRCEDRDMSSSSDRLMTIDGDTSDRRCEDRYMCRYTTSGDGSRFFVYLTKRVFFLDWGKQRFYWSRHLVI